MYQLTTKLSFGKYQGKTLHRVIKQDPDYVLWALDNVDSFDIDEEATEVLNMELDDIEFEDEVWGKGW